jgi:hypothetical protein
LHGFDAVMRMGRRLGALPPKRMIASWSGSHADPTGYKDAARCFAPNFGGLASVRLHSAYPPDERRLIQAGNRLNL